MNKDYKDHFIFANNLSVAWASAFLQTIEKGTDEISPLLVILSDLNNDQIPEIVEIRNALDEKLKKTDRQHPINTTANTIFPKNLWNKNKERSNLFNRYMEISKKIRKMRGNRYGTYFERLTNYGCNPETDSKTLNQLDKIIEAFKSGNHRRSLLQASLFDPFRDFTNQRQRGFPCLQQVSFVPTKDGELIINGYYPKELIFERGYGNYLGLCRLGQFMAHEMELRFTKMQCMIGVATYSNLKKKDLEDLTNKLKNILKKSSIHSPNTTEETYDKQRGLHCNLQ